IAFEVPAARAIAEGRWGRRKGEEEKRWFFPSFPFRLRLWYGCAHNAGQHLVACLGIALAKSTATKKSVRIRFKLQCALGRIKRNECIYTSKTGSSNSCRS